MVQASWQPAGHLHSTCCLVQFSVRWLRGERVRRQHRFGLACRRRRGMHCASANASQPEGLCVQRPPSQQRVRPPSPSQLHIHGEADQQKSDRHACRGRPASSTSGRHRLLSCPCWAAAPTWTQYQWTPTPCTCRPTRWTCMQRISSGQREGPWVRIWHWALMSSCIMAEVGAWMDAQPSPGLWCQCGVLCHMQAFSS